MPFKKTWHEPAPPKWFTKARDNIKAAAVAHPSIKVGSDIHLLEMACTDYENLRAALAFVGKHLTSEEGDREATKKTSGSMQTKSSKWRTTT